MYILVLLAIATVFLFVLKVRKIYAGNFISRFNTIHALTVHPHKVDFESDSPSFYYADFTRCILNKTHFINENGVYQIGGSSKETSNLNVCGVSEFAIINYEKFLLTKNEDNITAFKANLDWIKENAVSNYGMVYWYYDYDYGNHKAPWASAISQGMAISVLVRGYIYFKDEAYLKLAELASETLLKPLHANGFRYCYDHFECWLEESNSNSHILNGHIFALLGIYDLYRCTRNERLLNLFEKGCQDIKNNISFFELGFSSKYDAIQTYSADNSYHKIHVVLFDVLSKITKDDFFTSKASAWDRIYTSGRLKFFGFIYTINDTINQKIIKICK